MTLDEAIKHCQEVAEENQAIADACDYYGDNMAKCEKCADEHRQLAEWLKDYKRLLEQQPNDETIKYLECNDIDVQKFTEAMKKQRLRVIKPNICDDCISRENTKQFLYERLDKLNDNELYDIFSRIIDDMYNELPPVTPTQCIAAVRFSKDDLREICNERIEIECMHGTCKDCEYWDKEEHLCYALGFDTGKDWYCANYQKRGDSDGSN